MEKIERKIWSYFGTQSNAEFANNLDVRAADGHRVATYFELAKKVAELNFLNRDYILLFRGQHNDYRSTMNNSTIKPSMFRPEEDKNSVKGHLEGRFDDLKKAEDALVEHFKFAKFLGAEKIERSRILRWAILQHYEVCGTPLLDVTHSLRIAASFASRDSRHSDAFVFVLGVPNLSGAITTSSESGLQIVRLSSACPPEAVRPHLQEGYLLGEHPDMDSFKQSALYSPYELDFGRRLVAKFRFDPATLWHSQNFQPAPEEALYPKRHRDRLLELTKQIKSSLSRPEK